VRPAAAPPGAFRDRRETDMTVRRLKERRHAGGELVIPGFAVAFTLYYFSTIWNSPWTAQVGAFLIGGILLGLCALFAVKIVLALHAGDATFTFANLVTMEDWRVGRVGLLACTVGYCWFIEDLGFTLTTFLFLFLSMTILNRGRRIGLSAFVAAAMALCGWALFVWAFETRFPRGWFEETMRTVLTHG
jgi:hypothetical protein